VSLEINIISVLPILSSRDSFFGRELTIKYFLSQRIASIFFLVSFLFCQLFLAAAINLIFSCAILFKLGVPPFHSWFLNIIIMCPLDLIVVILFIQKFIPLHVLSKLNVSRPFVLLVTVLTFFTVFFYLKGLNSLRVILVLSAWGNSVWLIAGRRISDAWFIFLSVYGGLLFTALWGFKACNTQKISSFLKLPAALKIFSAINLLNLAGLPPFSGFFVKLFLIKRILMAAPLSLIFILLNSSLVVLFAYTLTTFYFLSSNLPTTEVKPMKGSNLMLSFRILAWGFFPVLIQLI